MLLIAGLPGGMEWVILLVVALLLFGGTRLAGMGKGAGRAIREFREETRGMRADKKPEQLTERPTDQTSTYIQPTNAQPTNVEQVNKHTDL